MAETRNSILIGVAAEKRRPDLIVFLTSKAGTFTCSMAAEFQKR